MSERDAFHRFPTEESLPNDEGGLHAPSNLGLLGKAWWWFHFAILVKLARLRFLAVLLAIGGVIAYWDWINAYYEKWTRPRSVPEASLSPDIEYSCPMHPSIVRDHPDKCPLCAMPLSRRRKSSKNEQEALPPGVSRPVQITPYKIAVAGIETAEVGYRPLNKEITTVGFVEFDERKLARISARVTGKTRIDKLYVNVTGQHVKRGEPLAELYSPDLVVTVQNLLDARRGNNRTLEQMARDRLRLWGVENDQMETILKTGRPITHVTIRSPIHGHIIRKYQVEGEYVEEGTRLYDVADLSTVWIEALVYEDELAFLKLNLPAIATTKAFPHQTFRGKLAFLHPHLDATTRTLKVRFDVDNPEHALRPGMYATVRFQAAVAHLALLREARLRQWRTQTMVNLTVTSLLSAGMPSLGSTLPSFLEAATCEAVAERELVPAVPEAAVIDTGSRQLVYRESEPGVFDQREVLLGPRSGAFYPVLDGLQSGERVATTGSFLIDAETRLTGDAASTYFGASGGPHREQHSSTRAARPSMKHEEDTLVSGSNVKANLAQLHPADRRLAQKQRRCLVHSENLLGSMGPPVVLEIKGQKVFVCCEGCTDAVRANPEQALARVKELRAKTAKHE